MNIEYTCDECKARLFDVEQLPQPEQRQVHAHLAHCDSCREDLAAIWELKRDATGWRAQPVPRWNRRQLFFEPSPWHFRFQWAASFASVVVLVLVLTEARISTIDGLTIDFAGVEDRFVSQTEFTRQLVSLQEQQQATLDTNVRKLTNQQITTNQLLLRTVLDASREERREELGNMLVLWEADQDQRTMSTEESLRYLIASQVQDRREIEQLSSVILDDNRRF